jgi:hypothetical protein
MPGKPLASDPSPWEALALQEEGGFAGLRRGAGVARASLAPAQRKKLDALVAMLPGPSRGGPKVSPDAQQLVLELKGPSGTRRMVFDRADLPEEVDALLSAVLGIAPFKPLPLP